MTAWFGDELLVHRLGWTLVHFLWQGTVIALLLALVRLAAGRALSAQIRYAMASVALATMAIAPVVTFVAESGQGRLSPGWLVPIDAVSALPWIVGMWLAGVSLLSVRLAGGLLFTRRLRRTGHVAAPPEWQRLFDELAGGLGISRPVMLRVSTLVDVPLVVGVLRPMVLVPVSALTGLPIDYLRTLLVHELAHVARFDYAINLLQRLVETLLFYHPAVWWVSGQIRVEREMCCDDVAVAAHADPLVYARALAQLESARRAHAPALAASETALLDRIRRLLGHTLSVWQWLPSPRAAVALLLLYVVSVVALGARDRPQLQSTPGVRRLATSDRAPSADAASSLIASALLGPIGPAAAQAPPVPIPSSAVPGMPVMRVDETARASGTGIIRGRVRRADTGAALQNVVVEASTQNVPESFWTTTDAEGRYALTELPPGTFGIRARKGGFVPARRPTAGPERITLGDGAVVDRTDLALTPGGVIAGQVLDQYGEPLRGAFVEVTPQDGRGLYADEGRHSDTTDDLGEFRLFGLPADSYVLSARAHQAARVFYPGTSRAEEASAFRLAAGEERAGVTLSLGAAWRKHRMIGVVRRADGQSVTGVWMMVFPETPSRGGPIQDISIRPDGSFAVADLDPGLYTVTATAPDGMTGVVRTELEGIERPIVVTLGPGATLRGRIVIDRNASREQVTPGTMRLYTDGRPGVSMSVRDDLTFDGTGLVGLHRLRMPTSRGGWNIKAIRVGGRDVTDAPLDFDGGSIDDVEIVVTNRFPTVTGRVSDERGRDARALVVVFAEDQSRWALGRPYVGATHATEGGRYTLPPVPAGRYFIIAVPPAVAEIASVNGERPTNLEVLQRLRAIGKRITLTEGAQVPIDLRLAEAR